VRARAKNGILEPIWNIPVILIEEYVVHLSRTKDIGAPENERERGENEGYAWGMMIHGFVIQDLLRPTPTLTLRILTISTVTGPKTGS